MKKRKVYSPPSVEVLSLARLCVDTNNSIDGYSGNASSGTGAFSNEREYGYQIWSDEEEEW